MTATLTALAKRLDRAAERLPPEPKPMPSALELAERAGFVPDPWQRDLLKSTAPRILLNASRQSGKSSTVSLLAVHQALAKAGSLVLILAPTQRQAAELLRTARRHYGMAGGQGLVSSKAESILSLTLENGSRLVALPAKDANIRGFSAVDLILIDEASRVDDGLYAAVRPMLAISGGRLIALSTPFGTRGWWWRAWTSTETWLRVEVPATQCPRITAEFLAEERLSLSDWQFQQEYLCRFMDAETAAFGSADVRRAFVEDVELWAV